MVGSLFIGWKQVRLMSLGCMMRDTPSTPCKTSHLSVSIAVYIWLYRPSICSIGLGNLLRITPVLKNRKYNPKRCWNLDWVDPQYGESAYSGVSKSADGTYSNGVLREDLHIFAQFGNSCVWLVVFFHYKNSNWRDYQVSDLEYFFGTTNML